MPRFYFHVRQGGLLVPDLEGTELPDRGCARDEAVNCARDLAAERIRAGRGLAGRSIEIEDEQGVLVDSVSLLDVIILGE